ncbi:cadherin-related family member 2-like [Styela clava]
MMKVLLVFILSSCALVNIKVHAQVSWVTDMDGQSYCENTSVGTHVYTLEANGAILYYIDNKANVPFDICGSGGGNVCLTAALNRESSSKHTVEVCASDNLNAPVCRSSDVFVQDENDNPPQFLNSPYIYNVLEGKTNGNYVFTSIAGDADDGKSGNVDFSLEGKESDKFTLSSKTSVERTFHVDVSLNMDLDFEIAQIHVVTLVATDQGGGCGNTTKQSSTANVYVNVINGPDQPPVFTPSSEYVTSMQEDSTILHGLSISASDGDYGLDWNIKYTLHGGDSVFSIDETTGVISVIGTVDRESEQTENGYFSLIVTATEVVPSTAAAEFPGFTGNPMSSNATVTINILDINDNQPLFYRSSDYKTTVTKYESSVQENSVNAVPNFSIYVQDKDQGKNAEFDLKLEGSNAKYFNLSPTKVQSQAIVTLLVNDSSGLDYEKVKSLNFEIVATDLSGIGTRANITIDLEDVNDNYPAFDSNSYEASIDEHTPNGTSVTTIKATDVDSGPFGEVSYSLLQTDSIFAITEDGTVQVTADTNREQRSEYYLTVRAVDKGGLANTTQLTITITDINDNAPTFQQNQYSANWVENTNVNDATPVSIYALDLDEAGTNNSKLTLKFTDVESELNYTITKISAEGGGTTFEVRPSHPLDAEATNGTCANGVIKSLLGVTVFDNGIPQRNDTADIAIYLEDANDFTPVFEKTEYSGEVAEASGIGTVIANVSATDGDICDPNNDIVYTVDDAFTDKFSIITNKDESLGTLQIKSDRLDRDDQDSYDVIVKAIDNGNPRKTGTATVKVTIADINNKNPLFNSSISNATATINENEDVNTIVTTLTANDLDTDSNLIYNITGVSCEDQNGNKVLSTKCDEWFKVVTSDQKGNIEVSSKLDRESVEKVTLSVQVEDVNANENYPKQTDSWTLVITILDYNDNPPEFVEIPKLIVIEEVETGTVIEQLSATDKDKGQTIEFSTSNDFVEVTPTGQLRVRGRIDREGNPGSFFTAVIFATDNGIPSLTSNETVNFTVSDTNDHSPSFSNQTYNCSIKENLSAGVVVCKIEATDEDIGPNADISYSIQPVDSFSVDSSSGNISTKVVFDQETQNEYRLTLKARDNAGSQSRENEVDVVITIIDEDDNDPTYKDFATQSMTISEEEEPEASVGDIKISFDADTEQYQNNYFFLVYKNDTEKGIFRLDKDTRKLYAIQKLDRETRGEFDLFVLTTGKSEITNESYFAYEENSILNVVVTVLDKNDNAPKFQTDIYSADLQNDVQTSASNAILTVSATDADISENAVLTYSIESQTYSGTGEQVDNFVIEKVNENANIYLVKPIESTIGESYSLTIKVEDGGSPRLSDTAKVTVRIFDLTDESVEAQSSYSPEYLNDHRIELEQDLEKRLEADVVIDSILAHNSETEPEARATDIAKSDVKFHATSWNTSTLVPAEEITTVLTNDNNNDILIKWSIVSISSGNANTVDPATETDLLKAVLVVACCLLVIVLVVYTTAFILMRRSYKRKLKVEKASAKSAASHERNDGGGALNIPNTNQAAAGKSKLFEEYEKGNVDVNIWRESNDDDSIDDNAVDSQDSAISTDPRDQEGLGQEYDELNDIDIDFDDSNDAENLTAALNAAKRKNGQEEIEFSFDNPAMENTPM